MGSLPARSEVVIGRRAPYSAELSGSAAAGFPQFALRFLIASAFKGVAAGLCWCLTCGVRRVATVNGRSGLPGSRSVARGSEPIAPSRPALAVMVTPIEAIASAHNCSG